MFTLFFQDKVRKNRGVPAQAGFTLLLAALVASIVLSLGSSIFTIARKQVTLSSLGRDSQYAFYAADTIAECALYHDVRFGWFATSTLSPQPTPAVQCDNMTAVPVVSATANSAVSSFSMTIFRRDENGVLLSTPGNCAQATITKNPTPPYTVIHADGYSTDCSTITTSGRALQRSIEITY